MKALLLGLAMGLGAATNAWAAQDEMVGALKALQVAKAHLENGLSNKGGHRMQALLLVNDAIGEVKASIAYARAFPNQDKFDKK